MLGVEPLLARVQAGDPGLQGGEVALGPLGAGDRLLAGGGEPADLLVGGGRAALQGVDLPVQAGQALAAVGGGPQQPGDPAVLLDVGLLGLLAGGEGGLERRTVALDLGDDLALLGADPLGLGLQLLGVAAGLGRRLGAVAGVADPLGREARRCP